MQFSELGKMVLNMYLKYKMQIRFTIHLKSKMQNAKCIFEKG